MPATTVRCIDHATRLSPPSHDMDVTAGRIFTALEPLHLMAARDGDLLYRASAGLRFIRSTGTYTETEHELFRIALAELGHVDAFVVEAAACYAADAVPFANRAGHRPERRADQLRALWLAAIIRIAESLCHGSGTAPEDVFAAWTDDAVYLEFDGDGVTERRVNDARGKVAALEALAGRTVFVASSATRRGAA